MGFDTVGIIGSGIMGSGITEAVLEAGYRVVLRSRQLESAKKMVGIVNSSFERKVSKGVKSPDEAIEQLGRLTITDSLADFAMCSLVIESVVEDLDVKLKLFGELDKICGESTILVSNTSTLPVIELAAITKRPDKVCGLHFFNPATKMPIVEVARTLLVSEDTFSKVTEFVHTLGKRAIEVKDQAGFVVNALLFPYLNNAIKLLESGVASKEAIDEAMKGGCGFPMGPFELLDLVGLDTSLAILNSLYNEFRDPNYAASPLLKRMVAANMYGRKNKIGFYTY